MTPQVRSLVPMAFVADVGRSIAFYEKLGFRVENTFTPSGETAPGWAWLERGDARLMVAAAGEPVVPDRQAVLFYLYYDDVAATKAELTAAGIGTGDITYPFYAPKGEFRVVDPDGFALMVTHT